MDPEVLLRQPAPGSDLNKTASGVRHAITAIYLSDSARRFGAALPRHPASPADPEWPRRNRLAATCERQMGCLKAKAAASPSCLQKISSVRGGKQNVNPKPLVPTGLSRPYFKKEFHGQPPLPKSRTQRLNKVRLHPPGSLLRAWVVTISAHHTRPPQKLCRQQAPRPRKTSPPILCRPTAMRRSRFPAPSPNHR